MAYSSSYLEGAESELDVKTGHTVTHSPKTEEEVLRILKLNLQPKITQRRLENLTQRPARNASRRPVHVARQGDSRNDAGGRKGAKVLE